ncbi:MAG: DUF2784 domain-containing protein [Terriglobales bacterium]
MGIYEDLAAAVTALHALYILWVIGGAALTRRRRWLAAAHIASLAWGVVVEVGPWPCPLTLLEQQLLTTAGQASYRGAFLLHYLQALVYPNLSDRILVIGAIVVCAANLGIYLRRYLAAPGREAHPAAAPAGAAPPPRPASKATHGVPAHFGRGR